MTDRSSSHVSTTDAIKALQQRGIDNAEELVSCTSPERVMATCYSWDRKTNVTAGLLAKLVRQGGVDPEPPAKASPRDRFAQLVQHYSEGSVTESHRHMARRQWPDDHEECPGAMVVLEDPTFPSLSVRCDACGFEASYPFKALAAGVLPDRPPVDPRPVPDSQPQVPEGARRPPASYPSVRGVHPVRFDERSLRWRR